MKLTEDMLYKYVPEATEERLKAELEQMPTEPVEFSHRFEKRMKRLIRKYKWPYRHIFYKSLKIAACFIAVVVTSGMILVLQVDALRQRFFESVNQFFDTYGITWFSADQTLDDMEMNEPGYLPEGFHKESEVITENFANYKYSNGTDTIKVNLTLVKDDMKVYFDTEYTSKEKVNLTYAVADFFIKDGKYAKIVFYKGMVQYEIYVNNSKFEKKLLIGIANSF